jgi:hypothetical protein
MNPPLGRKYIRRRILVRGGECSTLRCEVNSTWFWSGRTVRRIEMPAWLGSGGAVTWRQTDHWQLPKIKVDGQERPLADLLRRECPNFCVRGGLLNSSLLDLL